MSALAGLLLMLQGVSLEAPLDAAGAGQSASVEVKPAAEAGPTFRENLVSAFSKICVESKGSWEQMQHATDAFPAEFQKASRKKGNEIDYLAFPLWVGLKNVKNSRPICLVQSIIEDNADSAALTISSQLKALAPDLGQVVFKPTKSGLIGQLAADVDAVDSKAKRQFVEIRVSPSGLADGATVQLVIYSR